MHAIRRRCSSRFRHLMANADAEAGRAGVPGVAAAEKTAQVVVADLEVAEVMGLSVRAEAQVADAAAAREAVN